jgi:Tfp pilus assembly major pilin PilA
VIVGLWIVPAIFVIGIIAAVSIPAYQQYVERAAQTQGR